MMIRIDYPKPAFKIKEENERRYVFDSIRKTWLLLTEEEWVRQNFVHYLISVLQYPSTVMALEKQLLLNGLKKRFDLLIYNSAHQPWMLVECKAPHIVLDDSVLQQALRYNMSVPVSYVVITNGSNTYGWKKEEGSLVELEELPRW